MSGGALRGTLFAFGVVIAWLAAWAFYASSFPACTPDPVNTPTPTLQWTRPATGQIAGYKVYGRLAGGPWALIATLPCQTTISEDDGSLRTFCKGVDASYPIQRNTQTDRNNEEFTIRSFSPDGQISLDSSNSLIVCFAHVWRCCETYN